MGCCNTRIEYLEDLEYKQHIELKIIERDRAGNSIGRIFVPFDLPGPTDQNYNLFDLPKSKIRATGCVLQGIDPRGECEKECQDSYAFVSKDTNLLSVLFDGHGKDGRRVSIFLQGLYAEVL
jgi:hypothetical protein